MIKMIKGINICLIGVYKPWLGGISQHIQNLANQIKINNNIYVITPERFDFIKKERRFWNDDTIKIFQEKIYFTKYPAIQSTIQKTKRALVLSKTIDLYHPHSCYDALVGFIDEKKPLVLTIHGYSSLESLSRGTIRSNSIQYKLIHGIEKKAVHRADAIIAVDLRIYKWLTKKYNIKKEKIFHIPNGVDPKKFNPKIDTTKVRKKYGIENKAILLFVKALSPKNGPEVVIKAMKKIVNYYPDTILLIVGDGILKNKLLEMTITLKLDKNVIFCGEQSNDRLPEYYAASDIVVVPSVRVSNVEEATSITMLEGMASGKTVVASNIGGLKEIIAENKKEIGILFEENNHKEMAEKIISLLKDKKIRIEIGKNARKYIETERNWQLVGKEVMKVYDSVLK